MLFTRVLVHFVLAEFESRIEPKPKIPAGSQRETLDVGSIHEYDTTVTGGIIETSAGKAFVFAGGRKRTEAQSPWFK